MDDAMGRMAATRGWPRACPACGTDLVGEHVVYVIPEGPAAMASVGPGGVLSLFPGGPWVIAEHAICGNCRAVIEPAPTAI